MCRATTGWLFLFLPCALGLAGDPYLIGLSATDATPQQGTYPVSELRPVRRPGQFHYIRTSDGQYLLTDWWWTEVSTGSRAFRNGQPVAGDRGWRRWVPPVWLEIDIAGTPGEATEVPDRGGVGIGPGTIGTGGGRVTRFDRAVFVTVDGGRARERDGRPGVRQARFVIYEGERRKVRLALRDDTFIEIAATFDGYGVDLGAAKVAIVAPEWNGVSQSLGDSPEIDDLEVTVSWEDPERDAERTDEEREPRVQPGPNDHTDRPEGRVIHRKVIRYHEE